MTQESHPERQVRVAELIANTEGLPEHEARRLIQLAIGSGRGSLLSNPEIDERSARLYRELVQRRLSGEPLQYLEGDVQFGPITLRIDSRALIPRPETERLWELAVTQLIGIAVPFVIDLCTGSGNLALAIKSQVPAATVIGADVSADAISLARENADLVGLNVDFVAGDLFAALPLSLLNAVDLIVSNPPYVAAGEWESLPSDVRDHEPATALVAGPDGTEVLARIAADADRWLRPGGRVMCEMGETQGSACLGLFARYEPEILPDLTGRPRYVVGRVPQRHKLH